MCLYPVTRVEVGELLNRSIGLSLPVLTVREYLR
jgi:hypothetical protein